MIHTLVDNMQYFDAVVDLGVRMQERVTGVQNRQAVTSSFCSLVNAGVVYVSVLDGVVTGFIAGTVVYNRIAELAVLQEVAWYDEQKQGGRLLLRFKQAAKELDCDCVMLSVLESAGDAVHSSIQKAGYAQVERVYRLDI